MASDPPPRPSREKTKAPSKAKSFLFINKDKESEILSRSSGQVAASINSHVQRWQDKKGGKQKSQLKTQAPEQKESKAPKYRDCVTKFRPKPRKKPEKCASKHWIPLKSEHSESSSSGSMTACSTSPESSEGISEGDSALQIITQDALHPHTNAIPTANFSGADCIDPFQSTYAHYPGVQPILQYYISFTLVSTFQSDAKGNGVTKEPPHFPAIRKIVHGSLSQKMHMYALLAATAARMKRVSGITFPRESSPDFLLHNAIRGVREYFASCTGPIPFDDRQVILDIFYLCVCEWYEKSYDVARIHLTFVRHFWNSLRPADSIFDKYIHDMITYNDVFLAIETASPPLFELTWEPEPLPVKGAYEIEEETGKLSISPSQSPGSAATLSRSTLSTSTSALYSAKPNSTSLIATSFAALITTNTMQLPVELLDVLVDIIPLVQTVHHHAYTPTPPPPKETQWVSLKTQALLHKLLSLNLPPHTLAPSISLSLIILLSCMSTSAAWRAGKVDMPQLARRLRSALSLQPWQDARRPIVVDHAHHGETMSSSSSSSALSPFLRGTDDSLLLWILVSGAFAAQDHGPDEQWFLTQAGRCARRRMGVVADPATLKTDLLRWLYLDHLERGTLERLCTAMRLG